MITLSCLKFNIPARPSALFRLFSRFFYSRLKSQLALQLEATVLWLRYLLGAFRHDLASTTLAIMMTQLLGCKQLEERLNTSPPITEEPEQPDTPDPANPSPSPLETIQGLEEIRVENPDLEGYAFQRLSPVGKTIFLETRQYMADQRQAKYRRYAQPLQCSVNVAHVLKQAGLSIPYHATYAVPNLINHLQSQGGQVYTWPLYNQTDKSPLIDYLNTHFSEGIPAGSVVAGCTVSNCDPTDYTEAHVALAGDVNHRGELMIYHNNWLRPNTTRGIRMPYMVSITNFYNLESPREWMSTPWIRFERDDDGTITDLHSALPQLDDMDPLNGKYYITVVVPAQMQNELSSGQELAHHELIIEDNPHRDDLISHPDNNRSVCRSPEEGLKAMDARKTPQGSLHTELLNTLRPYNTSWIPYNSRFEFMSLREQNDWLAIKFYTLKRYFGGLDHEDSIWVEAKDAICKSQKEWLNL